MTPLNCFFADGFPPNPGAPSASGFQFAAPTLGSNIEPERELDYFRLGMGSFEGVNLGTQGI